MQSPSPRRLSLAQLGVVEYRETAQLQRALRAAREANAIGDTLLLLEHEPVVTCGTRTLPEEVSMVEAHGVPLVAIERGGKATYHGPGQIVAYPILNLELTKGDVKVLVSKLEQALIDTLEKYEINAARYCGEPGVWLDPDTPSARKIASIGLRLTRGITFHGIALNVDCNLTPFSWFTPCGLPDVRMTSMKNEQPNREFDLAQVAITLADNISTQFGLELEDIPVQPLRNKAEEFAQSEPELLLPSERAAKKLEEVGAK